MERSHRNQENAISGVESREKTKEKRESMGESKSQLEIMGKTSLTAEGCLGVEEYRPETVKLKFEDFHLRIFGNNLVLSHLRGGSLMISGRLSSLDFD